MHIKLCFLADKNTNRNIDKMSDAKFDAAFAKGDKDGSGGIGMRQKDNSFQLLNIFLDLNEAIALMKELGFTLTDDQVTEVFKKFDSDNSGELDKAECKQLVAQMMPNFYAQKIF